MKAIGVFFAMLVLFLFLATPQSYALEIVADATGYNVGYVRDFWGVNFLSGSGSISSVTFDLSAISGSYFDFDGSSFLGEPGVEPIIGTMSGISTGDISYPRGDISHPLGRPTTLTFSFLPGTFSAGDWFRFSADVDPSPSSGGDFGGQGFLFTVLMSTGDTYTSSFSKIDNLSSIASISEQTAVPEPSTFLLLGAGLAGVGMMRRKLKGMGKP